MLKLYHSSQKDSVQLQTIQLLTLKLTFVTAALNENKHSLLSLTLTHYVKNSTTRANKHTQVFDSCDKTMEHRFVKSCYVCNLLLVYLSLLITLSKYLLDSLQIVMVMYTRNEF